MRGDERPASVYDFAPVGFEGVGGVVEADAKEHFQEQVGHPVDKQLDFGVVHHAAALHKTAAKHTIPTLVQLLPVAHHVAAIVRFIRHHDYHGIALEVVKPADYGPPKTVQTFIPERFQLRQPCLQVAQQLPGSIGAAVVHHHDFMRNVAQAQLQVEVFHGRAKAALFIARGNDHREQRQRARRAWSGSAHAGRESRLAGGPSGRARPPARADRREGPQPGMIIIFAMRNAGRKCNPEALRDKLIPPPELSVCGRPGRKGPWGFGSKGLDLGRAGCLDGAA